MWGILAKFFFSKNNRSENLYVLLKNISFVLYIMLNLHKIEQPNYNCSTRNISSEVSFKGHFFSREFETCCFCQPKKKLFWCDKLSCVALFSPLIFFRSGAIGILLSILVFCNNLRFWNQWIGSPECYPTSEILGLPNRLLYFPEIKQMPNNLSSKRLYFRNH